MADIVGLNFNDGTLDGFDSVSTGRGAALSVTSPAALAGSEYGLRMDAPNDSAWAYGTKLLAWTTQVLRFRYYLDLNSIAMISGNSWYHIAFVAGGSLRIYVRTNYLTSSTVNFSAFFITDTGSHSGGQIGPIVLNTNEAYWIEIQTIRADTNVSANGSIEMWVNGVQQGIRTGIDIYDYSRPDGVRLGGSGLDAGTSGSIYIDELVVNDDGSEIGPVINFTPAILLPRRQLLVRNNQL